MQNAMSYSLNLISTLQDAILRIKQVLREDKFDSCGVLKHEMLNDNLITFWIGKFEERIRKTDLLNTTLCNYFFTIKYFILQ